jgi:hypothetical protein
MRRQRLAPLVVAVALLPGPGPALAAPPVAAGGPRLEIDHESVDLGRLVRGEVGRAQFAVRNAGDALLRILDVKPG